MTKREAIRDCKRLWKEIEKSGLGKVDFLMSPDGGKWRYKNYKSNCPLCEYDASKDDDCEACPLLTQYGQRCGRLGYWEVPRDNRFLDAVKGLKE